MLGENVGDDVGLFVRAAVDAAEGLCIEDAAGLFVGAVVGDAVGIFVEGG